ncbi:MAG TPA: ATPase [Casimicrobiaceae bacterium]|jgi:uncharacterized protein YndB with AHSA1/START domain
MTIFRRPGVLAGVALAWLALAVPVHAEVRSATPDAFQILFNDKVAAPPSAVYAAIGQIERWWDGAHTYSSDAANLSIAMQPGGCWCERWSGGAVEHARVVMLLRDQAVRVEGGLGPLQNLGVSAVLTFLLKAEDGGTALTVGYRVNGSSASGLDKLAQPVDGVIGGAVQRLKRYVETGKPTT